MGGHALKNEIDVQRMDVDTFIALQATVHVMLKHANRVIGLTDDAGMMWKYPRYFTEKDSFGDLDVVVFVPQNVSSKAYQFLRGSNDVVTSKTNGNVLSVAITIDNEPRQVDFIIFTDVLTYKTAIDYYSWNDFHGLLGVMTRLTWKQPYPDTFQWQLSLGHKGLVLEMFEGQYKKEVVLVRDFNDIYTLLDISFPGSFGNLEEMFEVIYASKYFTPKMADLSSLSHRNRVRNKKRPTFTKFGEWVRQKESSKETPSVSEEPNLLIRVFKLFVDAINKPEQPMSVEKNGLKLFIDRANETNVRLECDIAREMTAFISRLNLIREASDMFRFEDFEQTVQEVFEPNVVNDAKTLGQMFGGFKTMLHKEAHNEGLEYCDYIVEHMNKEKLRAKALNFILYYNKTEEE